MSGHRLSQINELVLREVGKLINEHIEDRSVLVTIREVQTAPNLASTKVYLSVFPKEKEKYAEAVLEKNLIGIQHTLNRRLRMKHVPRIIWVMGNNEVLFAEGGFV